MKIPFKVSTTTSNFMIGVTAAASAGCLPEPRLYRSSRRDARDAWGYSQGRSPEQRFSIQARVRTLRIIFGCVVLALAIEMIVNGLTGKV
jgi:uncharacterized protein